jgi:choline dehydrogenase-like flavoprotein
MSPEEVQRQPWDAVIVGTGIGGATLGYALAKTGLRVLFCEKGRQLRSNDVATLGRYAEETFPRAEVAGPQHAEILRHSGRYFAAITDKSPGQSRSYVPFIGCGTGGSSALYGMAMERFFPSDFTTGPDGLRRMRG